MPCAGRPAWWPHRPTPHNDVLAPMTQRETPRHEQLRRRGYRQRGTRTMTRYEVQSRRGTERSQTLRKETFATVCAMSHVLQCVHVPCVLVYKVGKHHHPKERRGESGTIPRTEGRKAAPPTRGGRGLPVIFSFISGPSGPLSFRALPLFMPQPTTEKARATATTNNKDATIPTKPT